MGIVTLTPGTVVCETVSVTFLRGELPIISDLSIQVRVGEVLAVVGPKSGLGLPYLGSGT